MLNDFEFKNMLTHLGKNVEDFDNKMLVDTLYSIGRIHKKQEIPYDSMFTKLLSSFTQEIETRCEHLTQFEIAYLCKALVYLQKHMDRLNIDESTLKYYLV